MAQPGRWCCSLSFELLLLRTRLQVLEEEVIEAEQALTGLEKKFVRPTPSCHPSAPIARRAWLPSHLG